MAKRVVWFAVLSLALVVGSLVAQESADSPAWQPLRTPDGQPDIQGVWASADTGMFSLNIEPSAHLRTLGLPQRTSPGGGARAQSPCPRPTKSTIVVDPPSGILPHQPWALERRNSVMRDYRAPEPWQIDPQTRAWPNGVPRVHIYSSVDGCVGGPWHVLQGSGYVLFLYETEHEFRYVPLDGRPQLREDIELWMGSSRGHWEGNTLVIETTNHNDSTRFDVVGNFHSDTLRVTERLTYVDAGTLEYRATIDDPQVYTRPWTIAIRNVRVPGLELLEYAGVEGEQNAAIATEEAAARAQRRRSAKLSKED